MKKVLITACFLLMFFKTTIACLAAPVDIGEQFLFKGDVGIAHVFNSVSSLVNVLIPNIFVVTGLLFLVLLIFAGFGIIVSAGSGDTEGSKKAKSAATAAAIGLALVFCSYWLIQIVEFVTGFKIFSPSF